MAELTISWWRQIVVPKQSIILLSAASSLRELQFTALMEIDRLQVLLRYPELTAYTGDASKNSSEICFLNYFFLEWLCRNGCPTCCSLLPTLHVFKFVKCCWCNRRARNKSFKLDCCSWKPSEVSEAIKLYNRFRYLKSSICNYFFNSDLEL